jgi:alcohol dehydrogenase class IV
MRVVPSFRYAPAPARLHLGDGALRQLAPEVERSGARRALIICGHTVAQRTELLQRVRDELGERLAGVFDVVEAESPLPSVEAAVERARAAEADLLIAIGGGSAVVTARAATILLAEGRDIHDLCTRYPPGEAPISPRLRQAKLPNIVVLTTPTTAANRSGAAVLDPVRRRRLELFDPKTRPQAILADGAALRTAPTDLFLKTATTTFCGAVTALQAPELNPFAEGDLRHALELSRICMPRLLSHPTDSVARVQLAAAALLSNRAADATSSGGGAGGVLTGIVHTLQARYDYAEQGPLTAAMLVPAMRFNREALSVGHVRLAAALGINSPSGDAAAEAVSAFLGGIGMARRLRDLGVPEADLDAIAGDAMQDFFLRSNPRPIREPAELVALIREAW